MNEINKLKYMNKKKDINCRRLGWKAFHCILIVFSIVAIILGIIGMNTPMQACVYDKPLASNYEFWFDCLYGCLTLLIISFNLMKFTDVETVKALSDLRSKLNESGNRNVHAYLIHAEDMNSIFFSKTKTHSQKINNEEDRCANKIPEDLDVFNYLGTIELGAIMLQRGVISFGEFYNQFGYRVINIANNEELMTYIQFEPERQFYDELWFVINEFQRRKLL